MFDDPNLVSQAGLGTLVGEHVRIGHRCGVNPRKVPGIAAGMIGGADSIDNLGRLQRLDWATG